MGFLAPVWLLLGGAVAIPLLIHLMRRRLGLRIEFPAARYLARAEQEHSRRLRLRNLLLMFVRVAAVLALALAAARPVTRWLGAGHAPTALAIVLDNSLSTGVVVDGRPLLQQLTGLARDVLGEAAATDRLFLVTVDGRVRGGSAATLRAELERVVAYPGAGDARIALARAAGAVRASGLDARQIVVLTDGQRTEWSESAYDLPGLDVALWLPPGAPPTNRAVVVAESRPPRWTPSGAVAARLLSRDSAAYRVTLSERTLARGSAARDEEIVVHATPPERGWVAGTVELEPDELPADNLRHFAAWIGPAPGVAVLPGAGPFAASALEALRGAGRVVPGRDIAIESADELTTLPALVTAPADPVRLGAANRALERARIPWRFGSLRRGDAPLRGDQADGAASARYELVAQGAAAAETLVTAGREPWVVAGAGYVLVASPLVPDATSFPVRASFVPWVARALTERLVGEPGGVIAAAPGARIARPAWAEGVEGPDGGRLALADSFDVPARAGTSFFLRAGRRVGALVVDAEARESVLDRWPAAALAGRLRAEHVDVARDRASWRAVVFRRASRRSLVTALLIVALVLLAVEAALVRASKPKVA